MSLEHDPPLGKVQERPARAAQRELDQPRRGVGGRRRDTRPAPLADLDKPLSLRDAERLAQAESTDAERLRELMFGRQFRAVIQPPLNDVLMKRQEYLTDTVAVPDAAQLMIRRVLPPADAPRTRPSCTTHYNMLLVFCESLRRGVRMTVRFPYTSVEPLELDGSVAADFFDLPDASPGPENATSASVEQIDPSAIVTNALRSPIGTEPLAELARGKRSVLVVFDDVSRPTPVAQFIESVLSELQAAGVHAHQITFMAALGTHRPMTRDEMAEKLGRSVVDRYACLNHEWDNPEALVYVGDTDQGVPVWINRKVIDSDLVIGIGSIMPIDICGYTGGGKIIVPGLAGPETVNRMHWARVFLRRDEVVGRPDNPVRTSIDALARKAGLGFIVNVVLDADGRVVAAVAGDMTAAHREGCRIAAGRFAVDYDREYDVVVADSHPFDIEFWQANKALDTAGHFVRAGGAIVLVTPCPEGWSRTHRDDILRFGYRGTVEIRRLVEEKAIRHSVVGVHMHQVSEVAFEKARLIIVSEGLPRTEVESVGFEWAATPQRAFARALELSGADSPRMAVLRNASRMTPVRVHGG
ncbi:MAG: nickel-dependent lactate racemase [Spirochaetaceae bacterium]|nr:MAG: nickel-dependent lactate racemase [Spirochaetaceae bacterium]